MEPNISFGQSVLVSNIPYIISKPKIGDIIAFKKKEKIFIKRIVKINPSTDGNKYFALGDNKKDSLDSQEFGWVDRKEIVGKVIYKI